MDGAEVVEGDPAAQLAQAAQIGRLIVNDQDGHVQLFTERESRFALCRSSNGQEIQSHQPQYLTAARNESVMKLPVLHSGKPGCLKIPVHQGCCLGDQPQRGDSRSSHRRALGNIS